jgi:hypothetical protein
MAGFGYIEVSVHHMDVRQGLSLGLPYGSRVLFRASLRIWEHFRSSMSRTLDVMRARLDGYPSQSGVMGIGTWNSFFIVGTSGVDDKIHTVMWLDPPAETEGTG